jgi:hypothetical protein
VVNPEGELVCATCGLVVDECATCESERGLKFLPKRGDIPLPISPLGTYIGKKDARNSEVGWPRWRPSGDGVYELQLKEEVARFGFPKWCIESVTSLKQYIDCVRELGVGEKLATVAVLYVFCRTKGLYIRLRLGRVVYHAMQCMGVKYMKRDAKELVLEVASKLGVSDPEILKLVEERVRRPLRSEVINAFFEVAKNDLQLQKKIRKLKKR